MNLQTSPAVWPFPSNQHFRFTNPLVRTHHWKEGGGRWVCVRMCVCTHNSSCWMHDWICVCVSVCAGVSMQAAWKRERKWERGRVCEEREVVVSNPVPVWNCWHLCFFSLHYVTGAVLRWISYKSPMQHIQHATSSLTSLIMDEEIVIQE